MSRVATVAALLVIAHASAAGTPPEQWTLALGRDEATWEDVATLSVESANEIADEYASKKVHPQLVFQCKPGADDALAVSVDWKRYISSFNTEVGFKAGDRELLLVNWGVDKTKKITRPRAAQDGRELIDYLRGADTLQVEVIPYAESLIAVTYDISGIDAALQALADKCR